MKPALLAPWSALALWATLSFALRSEWTLSGAARWAPDFGLALFASVAATQRTRDLPLLALVFALARGAASIDTPFANLAACLGFVGVMRITRLVIDVTQPAPLALLTLLASFALESWFALVHQARVEAQPLHRALGGAPTAEWWAAASACWPSALTTALVVLAGAPLFRRLPGLSALERKPSWPAAASFR